ncbi:MAG: CDP-diacylglycerol--serine O-phosphatidyltransferase [Planctomycetota bacterium]|jgi:CDP-diacylglycerol--serine O-phosphatidyltransferase
MAHYHASHTMKHVSMLPNLFTLANAACGLLALSKGIDALAGDPEHFPRMLETACWLVFLAMIFDALDGKVARLTDSFSDFGAQLDSFADAITFGVTPAILAKVLLERELGLHPRLHFMAAAAFSLMAILRLARFNLENDHDESSHSEFRGLPSPAAAGTLVATILMYLSIQGTIEVDGGIATPVGKGVAFLPEGVREFLASVLLPLCLILLPVLGFLMVSRVRYVHMGAAMFRRRQRFIALVQTVFIGLLLYMAPVPFLFVFGLTYVTWGLIASRRKRGSSSGGPTGVPDEEIAA